MNEKGYLTGVSYWRPKIVDREKRGHQWSLLAPKIRGEGKKVTEEPYRRPH